MRDNPECKLNFSVDDCRRCNSNLLHLLENTFDRKITSLTLNYNNVFGLTKRRHFSRKMYCTDTEVFFRFILLRHEDKRRL